jgi:hypothetical protein
LGVASDGAVELQGHRIFSDTYCALIAFEIELAPDNFDFDAFVKTLDGFMKTGKEPQRRFRNTCGTRSKGTDYHLHLTWDRKPDLITVDVEYARGYKEPNPNELEPLAEDFIKWLSQFLKKKKFRADVHSDFEFPAVSGRKVKFPLPMKVPIGPEAVEAEIDGLSVKLLPRPQGVEKVWVTQEEECLTVHLHAERMIDLESFDPRNDVLAISGVMDSMFQPRKLEEAEGKLQ